MVEITKEYYLQKLINKLRNIFRFKEDDEIEEYLNSNFVELLNLPENEFSVIKLAMEEVRDIPEKKQLITQITDTVLDKLEDFFSAQIEQGNIREVNPRVLAVMCFSLTFQSIILWRVYDKKPSVETEQYSKGFLDILYNGIKD